MTQVAENKIRKLAAFEESPQLGIVSELHDLNESLKVLAEKETPVVEQPEVQKISIEGIDVLTLKGKDGVDGKDSTIPGPKGEKGDKGDKGESIVGPRGEQGETGPIGPAGKDGESIVGPAGKDGSSDTAKQVKEKLESLEGEGRLDRKAIKGFQEEIDVLRKGIDSIPRGGGAKGMQIQVAGVKQQLTSQAVNFIAGSNVTITTTMVNGIPTLSFSSSGASANQANNETPSGTINGVNTVFTLAHTPSPAASLKLYLNGAFQTAGGEDYTLVADTITFVNAPLTGGILRSFYDYA